MSAGITAGGRPTARAACPLRGTRLRSIEINPGV
jgi:hypothetical protein